MGVLKQFENFVVSAPQKKYALLEVLIPIGWCDFLPAWQNLKQKVACIPLDLGVQDAFKVSYLLVEVPS